LTSAARARLGAAGYTPAQGRKFDGLLSSGNVVTPLKPRSDG